MNQILALVVRGFQLKNRCMQNNESKSDIYIWFESRILNPNLKLIPNPRLSNLKIRRLTDSCRISNPNLPITQVSRISNLESESQKFVFANQNLGSESRNKLKTRILRFEVRIVRFAIHCIRLEFYFRICDFLPANFPIFRKLY